MVRGDYHIHSDCSFGDILKYDGLYSPKIMVKEGNRRGLEWMGFTEHNTLKGKEKWIEAGKKYGVTILPGIEMTFKTGRKFGFWDEQMHVIALGVQEEPPEKIIKEGLEGFCYWVKDQDGITISPHTYGIAGLKEKAGEKYIDAIEIFNPQLHPLANLRAKWLCKKINKIPTAGSDSHLIETLGSVEIDVDSSKNSDDILQALKKGKFKIVKSNYYSFFQPYRILREKYKINFDGALEYINNRENHFEKVFGLELLYSGLSDKLGAKIFYTCAYLGWQIYDTFQQFCGLMKDLLE